MSKSSKITASELVLSAIFFLQQKNGVTAKDITKFICEKRGCRQSQVRSEVKKALERATENGIFSKKKGLYRIESGFGKNKISIRVRGTQKNRRMKKIKHPNPVKATPEDSYKDVVDAPMFAPAVEMPSFSNKRSYSKHTCPAGHMIMLNDGLHGRGSVKKILIEQAKCTKSAYDDDDEDDEDFFEEDDDEDDVDYFADDQFPSAADAVKEYPPSEPEPEPEPDVEEKKREPVKRKVQSRSKSRTKGKTKRRKLSKPKKKAGKRKRNVVMRKNQKKNRGTETGSDEELKQDDGENEYGPDGENDDNMELDSQGEDNDYVGEEDEYAQNDVDLPEGSDYDNDNDENEHNHEDYDYGDDDYPSDEEYAKQENHTSKENKKDENKDSTAKREEEGDQKDKKQPTVTTPVKLNQNSKPENKGNSESSPATPTAATQQEVANQDKKSKPIRSSSLFSSFKKKNESKNSSVDRKQIKSRM